MDLSLDLSARTIQYGTMIAINFINLILIQFSNSDLKWVNELFSF